MVKKSKTEPSYCRICGEPALYRYFGIISCHACKIFFKRNAHMGLKSFHCLSNENCQINRTNRHVCTWCRLNKCFERGMQIELIRCPRISKFNWSILNNHQLQSLLDLVKLFDNQTILTFIQNRIHLPIKLRLKTSSIDRLLATIFEQFSLFFEINPNLFHLSSHDHRILLRSVMTNTVHLFLSLFLDEIPITIKNRLFKSNDHEKLVLKFAIIILMFSNNFNRQSFDNEQQIFELENFYINLIWNYLLRKYDSTQIIVCFLEYFQMILFLIETVNPNSYRRDLVEQILNKIKY